jgi:hypothetical protein
LLLLSRALNHNITLSSQGSRAGATAGGDGPHDPTVGEAHDGGVPAPESDSMVDVTVAGSAPPRTEPVARGVFLPRRRTMMSLRL